MTDTTPRELICPACVAYLAHYPIMADEWECDHGDDERAFMLALADAIHGEEPVGEFADAGWRAAQFLDDAEVALGCGHAPYVMQITHNVDPWSFMALVNGHYLLGTRNDEGAELESIADIGWLQPLRAAALSAALDENAQMLASIVELAPADPVLVEGSWFERALLPDVLGNFMRAAQAYSREAKEAFAENDRLRENLSHATISAQTFREEADRLREVIAEARADAEEGTKCTYSNGQVAQALDTLAILAKAVQS